MIRQRVVVDANVWISAFFFPGGPPEEVAELALSRQIESITCIPLLQQVERASRKFGIAEVGV